MFHVNVKNLVLASAVAVCAATPSLSQAFPDLDLGAFHPIIGVDGQYRYMEFQNGFGDNLWKETYPQANLYAGLRFGSYFGFVVGHENSKTRDQTVNLSPGETFLGTNPFVGATAIRGSSDIKGTYAQVMGYYPLSFLKSTEVFLGIGAIHNKIHLEYQFLDGSTSRNFNESDTHAKVEFGIQKIICNHFGLRAVAGWENTEEFENLKPVENPGAATSVNLHDTWTVGAGFFWIF
jgi:opacity protein-like surface antigen